MADHVIAQQVKPGDLVITGDIPLASWVIDAGARRSAPAADLHPRNHQGAPRHAQLHGRTALSRGSDRRPRPLNAADKQRFANALDKWLVRASSDPCPTPSDGARPASCGRPETARRKTTPPAGAGVVSTTRRDELEHYAGDDGGEQAHQGGAVDQLQAEAGDHVAPSLRSAPSLHRR